MNQVYNIPLDPMQYGVLIIALRRDNRERATELAYQIERAVDRSGLKGITVTMDLHDYIICESCLFDIAANSGITDAAYDLLSHIEYFLYSRNEFKTAVKQ